MVQPLWVSLCQTACLSQLWVSKAALCTGLRLSKPLSGLTTATRQAPDSTGPRKDMVLGYPEPKSGLSLDWGRACTTSLPHHGLNGPSNNLLPSFPGGD